MEVNLIENQINIDGVKDCLTCVASFLSQELNLARRSCEHFKSSYQQWRQVRLKVLNDIENLLDLMKLETVQLTFNVFISKAQSVRKDLELDIETAHSLLTKFNEYLNHVEKIKHAFDETTLNKLSECIVHVFKAENPDDSLNFQLPVSNLNLFDILPLLKVMRSVSVYQTCVLDQMIEHLYYLSCQWNIVEELSALKRGRRQDFGASPNHCDISQNTDKCVCYDDIVSNLTIASTAHAAFSAIAKLEKDSIIHQARDICTRLTTIHQSMYFKTMKVGLVTELLIAET